MQRRLDALVDICRAHLDHGDTPVVGGERPHVSVIVDWQTLANTTGAIGGATAIYNLILLCRYHHRWVHELLDRGPPHRALAELIT